MAEEAADFTLIYLHIPKCAGTSLMPILQANYGDGFYRVKNGGGWRTFGKLPLEQRASIRCLTGHLPWGLHQHLPGRYRYAVMLRDPVERIASLYWFCRRFVKHKWHKQAQRCGLSEFARIAFFADLDNGMTRWLVGRHDVGSLPIAGPLTEDDLRLAKVHLGGASVGFVETFKASLQAWAWEFGWIDAKAGHKMAGNYPGPTAEERRIIREFNAYDVELYEWARAS